MDRNELIDKAREFFSSNPLVTLMTMEAGRPTARPVSNPFMHEGKFYIITGASSRKIKQIEADPQAGIFAYSEKGFTYCTVQGLASMTRDRSLRARFWKEELTRYFPKGVDDPEYCFIVLDVRGVEFVDYSKGFDKPVIHREIW